MIIILSQKEQTTHTSLQTHTYTQQQKLEKLLHDLNLNFQSCKLNIKVSQTCCLKLFLMLRFCFFLFPTSSFLFFCFFIIVAFPAFLSAVFLHPSPAPLSPIRSREAFRLPQVEVKTAGSLR